jgi:hypothetical protein
MQEKVGMEKEKVDPITAVSTENLQDEQGIINDRDVTNRNQNPGAEGTDSVSLVEPEDFTRGELDVKMQIDRATRVMDNATGRSKRDMKRRKIL